jgi:hypothetical protein
MTGPVDRHQPPPTYGYPIFVALFGAWHERSDVYSALPNAPVVPDHPRRPRRLRVLRVLRRLRHPGLADWRRTSRSRVSVGTVCATCGVGGDLPGRSRAAAPPAATGPFSPG